MVQLQGELNEAWASMLRRAHNAGREAGAAMFVLELDTPGGEAELMKRLGDQIDAVRVDMATVVYVTHRAWSAGAFLAMAGQQIWMAPGSSMGAAMPVTMGPGGIAAPGGEDEAVREKILSAFRAEFRAWAERHGRDPNVAEAFVDASAELKKISLEGEIRVVSGQEYSDLVAQGRAPRFLETIDSREDLLVLTPDRARELGFCDGIAADRAALLAALGLAERPLLQVHPTWSEALVSFIGSYSWLLLLGIAFCLIVAFNMPGLGGAELLAAILLAVFLFHGYLVGLAEWTEVGLVLLGLALIFVELFVMPGTVLPGLAGAVLVAAGLLLSMQDFVLPVGAIEVGAFRRNLVVIVVLMLAAPILGAMALRSFSRTRLGARLFSIPVTSLAGPAAASAGEREPVEARPGDEGVAASPLRPAGRVTVRGIPFDARSTGGFVPEGSRVRVLRRDGATLLVAPLETRA